MQYGHLSFPFDLKFDIFIFSQVYYFNINGLMSTVLTERKRFNYNVGTSQSNRSNHSQKKIVVNSFLPASHIKDQNMHTTKAPQTKENNKKIQELEAVNRKIIEDTTLQFKKLELDVHRVEKILEEKESQIVQLVADKNQLQSSLEKMSEEKKILIEAIFEKDLIIKEFEEKLKEFFKNGNISLKAQVKPSSQTLETEMQTDPIAELNFKNELNSYASKNRQLQNELYETKQELFDARNKVKLLTQQFEAYKVLKQIENVQDV